MNSTAALRLDRTEHTFSLTITLPRPAFRLPKWARRARRKALRTEEARLWETVSYSKEHAADLPDKTIR